MGHIYIIAHKTLDRVYVGQTTSLKRRFYRHRYLLTRGAHDNPGLQRDWIAFGPETFVFEVVATIPDNLLTPVEQAWLDTLPLLGFATYNVCAVAESRRGVPQSEATRARISAAGKGRVVSEETRARMRIAQKAACNTPERLQRLRESGLGRVLTPEAVAKRTASRGDWKPSAEHLESLQASRRGKTHTDATKAQIGASNRGKVRSEEARRKMSDAAKARHAVVTQALTKPEKA